MSEASPQVLVVDDDIDTCRNLSDILTDIGFAVETRSDGPSALALVRERPFDVALLDLKMPGMDGLTLYGEIKKLRADTVAIIVTAYAAGGAAERALNAGAWRVLSKPLDVEQLIPLVEEASRQPLVMVVDDDDDLCQSLWDVLRGRGYRVCVAHDEAEAANLLRDGSYRVVLIDMKLPRGDGESVFQLVRSTNPDARVVLITGHGGELQDLVQRVIAEGADAVCYKPFDVPRLLETVDRLAGSRA